MLTEKEIKVLELRGQNKTQTQVAKELKISQAAVSFFEKNALQKIHDSIKTIDYAKKEKIEVKHD